MKKPRLIPAVIHRTIHVLGMEDILRRYNGSGKRDIACRFLALGESMDTTQIVAWANGIGLVLNMIGVGIVFFFGFPQPPSAIGGLMLEDNNRLPDGRTLGDARKDLQKSQKTYRKLSQLGLFFMFAGFVLQLGATVYGARSR